MEHDCITYQGYPERTLEGGFKVFKITEKGGVITFFPTASQKLYNHSPDGFAWGYEGSGPAQLALALIYDATRDKEVALASYQNFKFKIVSSWPMDEKWEITDDKIREWLENNHYNNPIGD